MNSNMMLLMVLALGSSSSSNGSKGSSSDFLDAYLISSNMMPSTRPDVTIPMLQRGTSGKCPKRKIRPNSERITK